MQWLKHKTKSYRLLQYQLYREGIQRKVFENPTKPTPHLRPCPLRVRLHLIRPRRHLLHSVWRQNRTYLRSDIALQELQRNKPSRSQPGQSSYYTKSNTTSRIMPIATDKHTFKQMYLSKYTTATPVNPRDVAETQRFASPAYAGGDVCGRHVAICGPAQRAWCRH
jgi:hypothetical protein